MFVRCIDTYLPGYKMSHHTTWLLFTDSKHFTNVTNLNCKAFTCIVFLFYFVSASSSCIISYNTTLKYHRLKPIILYSFNPLKTMRRPLYLKTQSVLRCKHFSSRL